MRNQSAIMLAAIVIISSLLSITTSSYTRHPDSKSFICSHDMNSSSFTYLNNVNLLLKDCNAKSSLKAYYNTSYGVHPNIVYGFYMCQGDLTLEDCHSCILNGTEFARKTDCQYKDGFYSTDKCLFLYSNHSTFGDWRQSFVGFSEPLGAKVLNLRTFNRTLMQVLEAVIDEAAGDKLGFATREGNVTRDQKIYSLAQCTLDLVEASTCEDCLRRSLSLLWDCCGGYEGANLGVSKCQLRYDTVPFYNLGQVKHSNGNRIRSAVTFMMFLILVIFS